MAVQRKNPARRVREVRPVGPAPRAARLPERMAGNAWAEEHWRKTAVNGPVDRMARAFHGGPALRLESFRP